MKTASRIGVLICLGLLVGLPLWAVTQNALVTGDIFDPKGAPIAGATVRLINAATGFSQSLQTDASGHFTFPSVPPAENYVLSVEASGFATAIRPGVTIQVGEAKLVLPPFLLQASTQPGEEKREEPSEAPTVGLDMVSTTMGGVIDSSNLRTLPLGNRDFLDLGLLISGTYPVEQGSTLEGASLVVNGIRANMNNFLLEGVDNNDYTVNQSLPFQLVEALQEFRVQTSTSAAEFGRSGGAQINSVTRSGSNDLHGTFFWFNRVDALSASNPLSAYKGGTFDAFENWSRIDSQIDATPDFPNRVLSDPLLAGIYNDGRTPPLTQNQFGINVGAPIKKDKVFMFFNWESFRAHNERPVFSRVPSGLLRDPACCVFDSSTALANALFNLYPFPNVGTSTVTDAFGNPVSDPMFGDVNCGPFSGCSSASFIAGESANSTDSDNLLGRLDARVSDHVGLSFKYNIQFVRQAQGGDLFATSAYPGNGIDTEGRNQNFSFNYNHQVSDAFFNEFRFGWNRFRLDSEPLDSPINSCGFFFNLNFCNRGLPTILSGGVFSFGQTSRLGAPLDAPTNRANNVWQFSDNISWVRGRHTIKVGGEIRHVRLNVRNEALGRGVLTFFNNAWIANTGLGDIASIAGTDLEFNRGEDTTPTFTPGGGFDRSFSANSLDLFIQDTWRARKNVTINVGLRYELNQAPREARDRLINNYPGACPDPLCLIQSGSNAVLSPFLGPFGDSMGAVFGDDVISTATAGFTAPRAGYHTDKNNFGPHIGLAWDPFDKGKLVLRGSYGIFFDQESFTPSVNMLHNPPYVQQVFSFFDFFDLADVYAPVVGPGFFGGYFNNGGASREFFDNDGDGSFSEWFRGPYGIVTIDPDRRTPYVHQWNTSMQYQVDNNSLFEVAYVGSIGHKLPRSRLLLGCDQSAFIGDSGLTCANNFVGFGTDPTQALSVVNQENTANSNFHSLQIRWETRQFHGLTLNMFYQWAKSIDNASSLSAPTILFSPGAGNFLCGFFAINCDQFAAVNTLSNPALNLRPGYPIITTRPLFPQDSSNLRGERGVSDFDVRHRFILRYIYDVPKFAGAVGSGWQLAGITPFQSGQPFSVYTDFFGVPLRPDLVGTGNVDGSNPDGAIDGGTVIGCNVFATCPGTSTSSSFDPTTNTQFQPGDLGRNTFTGDGIVNFDFSILKNTYLGQDERYNIQFRMEVFNLWNHANYRLPYSNGGQVLDFSGFGGGSTIFPDPFFGTILQSRAPREIQFGVKLIF